MSKPSPGTPAPERPLDDRLDSWKEIAAYLNRDVTTAQRWEKREAMPVHRHLHDRMGSVYASRAELDAWARSRNVQAAGQNGNEASPIPPAPLPHRRYRPPGQRRSFPAAGGGRRRTGNRRRPLASADRVLLAKPHRRRTLSNHHRLRWSGAGRCGVTRWSFCRVPVGPGRTDGRLGYAGRFGTVPQLDSRQRAGTRKPIHPHPGVLPRRISGHLLGPQAKCLERRRHQHLGGAHAGRRAEAIS